MSSIQDVGIEYTDVSLFRGLPLLYVYRGSLISGDMNRGVPLYMQLLYILGHYYKQAVTSKNTLIAILCDISQYFMP